MRKISNSHLLFENFVQTEEFVDSFTQPTTTILVPRNRIGRTHSAEKSTSGEMHLCVESIHNSCRMFFIHKFHVYYHTCRTKTAHSIQTHSVA